MLASLPTPGIIQRDASYALSILAAASSLDELTVGKQVGYRPTVEINGGKLIVGWTRRAIERTCERLSPRWNSYLGLGDVFAFFHQCRRFDSCTLHGGRQIGFPFIRRTTEY